MNYVIYSLNKNLVLYINTVICYRDCMFPYIKTQLVKSLETF
jgi:hypothetical protein